MQTVKTILCDLTGYNLNTVEVALDDNLTRAVRCRLRENGAEWTPPEGATASVAYLLPDGTPGRYSTLPNGSAAAVIDGSSVVAILSDRITAQTGAVAVSVVLTLGEAQLATFPFRVNVIGIQTLTNPATYPSLGAEFEGLLLYGGPGGVVTPLKLGPGLSIRDGVLYVSGGTDEPETPVGVVDTTVDESGTLRVYLDGVEIIPVVDDAGTLTWPGLLLVVGDDGGTTLVKED